jgi:hypothetical protein
VVGDAPYVVSRINPTDDPARLVLNLDWMVAGFTVLLALVVTALFGMLPALRASKVRPVSALKGGDEPLSKAAWMQSMIAVQVAFCLVVLFIAGLFAATEATLAQRPMGFTAERLPRRAPGHPPPPGPEKRKSRCSCPPQSSVCLQFLERL